MKHRLIFKENSKILSIGSESSFLVSGLISLTLPTTIIFFFYGRTILNKDWHLLTSVSFLITFYLWGVMVLWIIGSFILSVGFQFFFYFFKSYQKKILQSHHFYWTQWYLLGLALLIYLSTFEMKHCYFDDIFVLGAKTQWRIITLFIV